MNQNDNNQDIHNDTEILELRSKKKIIKKSDSKTSKEKNDIVKPPAEFTENLL